MNEKILAIEGDPTLQETLAYNLNLKGIRPRNRKDGKTAVELNRSNNHLKNRRTNARLVRGVYDYNCDP
jgi:DNA-binding response OmpR family regulator